MLSFNVAPSSARSSLGIAPLPRCLQNPLYTFPTLTRGPRHRYISVYSKTMVKNRYFPGAKAAAAARRPSDGAAGATLSAAANASKPRKRELNDADGAGGVKVKRKRKNGKRYVRILQDLGPGAVKWPREAWSAAGGGRESPCRSCCFASFDWLDPRFFSSLRRPFFLQLSESAKLPWRLARFFSLRLFFFFLPFPRNKKLTNEN